MSQTDQIQRFIFENLPIRGEIVRLHDSYQEVSLRHPYPETVKQFLGQTLVAVSLLSATLKYQGSLILQVQGDGPISLLLAQANSEQQLRGLANWQDDELVSDDFAKSVGQGRLMITIDPGTGGERYQGVVNLEGKSLAQVIENYFHQSEQLETHLYLTANNDGAAGFLLQLMPENEAVHVNERKGLLWEEIKHLAATITDDELLNLPNEQLLHRLFHEHDLRLLSEQDVMFSCRCNQERMANAILTLGKTDALALIKEYKNIVVTCEFCRKEHAFNAQEVNEIFKEPT